MKIGNILMVLLVFFILIVSLALFKQPAIQFDDFGPEPPPTASINIYQNIFLLFGILIAVIKSWKLKN